MHKPRSLSIFLLFCCSLCLHTSADAIADQAPLPQDSLRATYHDIKDALAHTIFESPIQLNSKTGEDSAQGDVFAIVDTPFAGVRNALSQPSHWCDLAILHVNIKTCLYQKNQVQLFVGRKHYQTPDEAFALQYRFTQLSNTDQYLSIRLSAPNGPLGTSNYLINFQAIPIDEKSSFIHFQYRYQFGFAAKLAMKTYLATLGRKKVGFTVTGKNEEGEAIYIKGLQGVIERNVMRYIFAIQSVLDAEKSTAERLAHTRMLRWYALIQKHPKQLVEVSREEYLLDKKRELKNQLEMQKTMQP